MWDFTEITIFVTSKEKKELKPQEPKPCHCFLPKHSFQQPEFTSSPWTQHISFSEEQIYLRKDIPNVGIIWTAVGSSPITAVSLAVIITLSQTIFCWIKITFMWSNSSNNKNLYSTALKKTQSTSFIQSQDFTWGLTWPCNPNGSQFPLIQNFSKKFWFRCFVYRYFVAGCISSFSYLIT